LILALMAMRGRAEEARSQGVLDKRDGPVGGRTWNFDRCRQSAEGDGFALAGLNECDRQGVQVHVFPPHCCKNSVRSSTYDTTAARRGFAQVVVGVAGVIHLTTSLLVLLAPYSYFMVLELVPPYNPPPLNPASAARVAIQLLIVVK